MDLSMEFPLKVKLVLAKAIFDDFGSVHSGFLKSYMSVADGVVAEILNLVNQFPDFDVVLTGHSLGGAQTTLLAMDLAYNHGLVGAYIITFGSPRVGNVDFATAFNNVYAGRSWRVTHEYDIVAHVPLRNMLTETFHHVGTEVWYYDDKGDYKFGDGSGEDPNESDSNLVDFSLPDHLTYLSIVFIICL
jgi:predicted lipase